MHYEIELLERIANAVEAIAGALCNKSPNAPVDNRKAVAPVGSSPPRTPPSNTGILIKAYCDAFRDRYGMSPPIDGKTAGLAKNLLKTVALEKAVSLVQAYCQMRDKWFDTKCHDFATFCQNINRVAVALFHGTNDPKEKDYWAQVFGGSNGQDSLSGPDSPAGGELRRASLQGRTGQHLLAGVRECPERSFRGSDHDVDCGAEDTTDAQGDLEGC